MLECLSVVVWGMAVFVLPGYALLVLSGLWPDLGVVERLCAASGLSIAIAPLLLYLVTLLGLRLNREGLFAFLSLAAAMCIWDGWQRSRRWFGQANRRIDLVYFLLGGVFLLTLFARIVMVRNIDYPLWTDSYHHTLISQMIADGGQVPTSYEPYIPIDRFTYHFGFHTLVAWFNWLSGISVPRSVVLVGQIVNALAVPTTYLLAWRMFQNRWAGLTSAWVVGLISHMPTFFVNWGRYTQLAGQVLLPVLMIMTLDAFDLTRNDNRRMWILTGIGTTGMFLVHVRMFLFYGLFAGLVLFFRLISSWRKPDALKRLLIGSVVICVVAAVVMLPWLLRFFSGFGLRVAQEMASDYTSHDYGSYFAFRAQDILDYGMRIELLVVASIAALAGIIKKNWNVRLLLIWLFILFVAANTSLINLDALFSNTIVIICIYLPAAVLIGYGASEFIAWATRWINPLPVQVSRDLKVSAVAGFLLVSLWGVGYTVELILPENGFVRPADLEAMQWIQENTPQDALFHISAYFWQPDVVHGLDAGFWIPFLAQRQTTIPAQVYDSDGSAGYAAFINRRARMLLGANTPEQLWQVMREYHVTHVYIGNRQTGLHPEFFLAAPTRFRVLYSKDNVWVFKVIE